MRNGPEASIGKRRGDAPSQMETLEPRLLLSDVDLYVSYVSYPATTAPGAAIEVSWGVFNSGSEAATADWHDRIYLSDNDTLEEGTDRLVAEDSADDRTPLAGGTYYSVTRNVTLPADAAPGARYLLFVTDADRQQAETREDNNVRPALIEVVDADLVVSAASAPVSAYLNDTIHISWTVANTGTSRASAGWTDVVYLSKDAVLDQWQPDGGEEGEWDWDWTLGYHAVAPDTPLDAGSSYTASLDASLPDSCTGNCYLIIKTNDWSGQVERSTANNVRVVPIRLMKPDVDLVVPWARAPMSARVNQIIDVSWIVTNQGTAAAKGPWGDMVYLSDDATFDETDKEALWQSSETRLPLAGGASYQASANVTVPNSDAGPHYLLFVADGSCSEQAETRENNNAWAAPITLALPDVDLAVSSVTVPPDAGWGQAVEVSWTVANQGAEAANADWSDSVYFSEDDVLDPSDAWLTEQWVQAETPLAPGSTCALSATVMIPSGHTGEHYLLFSTDVRDSQYETNEANNVRAVPIATTGSDLFVESASAPPRASLGSAVEISWTVVNRGDGPAVADWWDHVYISSDVTLDAADTFVDAAPVVDQTPLAPGASYTVSRVVTIPATAVGPRYLLFVADADSQQAEADETNNVMAVPFFVAGDADLVISQAAAPASAASGSTIAVSWTVANDGGSPADASWYDAVYLSDDNVWDGADGLLASGWKNVAGSLAVGGSYTAERSLSLPLVADGDWFLVFVADRGRNLLEGNRANNVYAKPIHLTVSALEDGVAVAGALGQSASGQCYRIEVPAGKNLWVALDDADDQGANELYAKFGSPPTTSSYDARSSGEKADQELVVSSPAPGTWYVLAYGHYVPPDGAYTVQADLFTLRLSGVAPAHWGDTTAPTLTLAGGGFSGTNTVALVAADQTVYLPDVLHADSGTSMTATFPAGLPVGRYTVRVTPSEGEPVELADAFEIREGGVPELRTNLVVPNWVGYHGLATLYVEYSNVGDAAIAAPLLLLTGTQNSQQRALLTLDSSRLTAGFWTSDVPYGFRTTIQILGSGASPGILAPGEAFRVPVYYAGWQQPWDFRYPPIDFSLGVVDTASTGPVDWDSMKASARPDSIGAEAWDPVWTNFVNHVGVTWGDYVKMLDDNAAYLGHLGDRVTDVGQLVAFELQQADGLVPLAGLAGETDVSVAAAGLPLTFGRFALPHVSDRYELGPLGRGWSYTWNTRLECGSGGSVTVIEADGSRRVFQPDLRGGYLAGPGEYGTLWTDGVDYYLGEPNGLTVAYNGDGTLDHVGDTNGNRIDAGYSGGRLTTLTHSDGRQIQIAYNGGGRIEQITDPFGRATHFTYDAASEHLLAAERYDGLTTRYTYVTGQGAACEHALASVEFPDGSHEYFAYSADGALHSIGRDGGAEAVTFAYDSAGTVSATDALGGVTRYLFDYRGLMPRTQDALGHETSRAYDDRNNLRLITGPSGQSYAYGYDRLGNAVRIADPAGQATSLTYTGALNRLALLRDARGSETRYTYDEHGNPTRVQYADGSAETWQYDEAGNPVAWTNRRGSTVTYAYDAYGRLTAKEYPGGSSVEYAYDSRGNLTSTVDATGTATFMYDTFDRLTRISYPGGRFLEYTYDSAGRRARSVDDAGYTVNYDYDALGRLESLTDGDDGLMVHYAYDAAGRLAREDKGSGAYATYENDGAGQVLRVTNYGPDGSVLSRFDYTYDGDGRCTSMTTLDGAWQYEYDVLGQLVAATAPDGTRTAYAYDGLGNRVSVTVDGTPTAYQTNSLNQYTQAGDATYAYDADGNLVQVSSTEGTTTYTYDVENRLVGVTCGADTWQYVYDALGRRVETIVNGVATRHIIDPVGLGNRTGDYDGSGNLIAHYDYGLGLLSETDASGDAAYYLFDALGSTRQVTDESGAVVNTYDYSPFGELLASTGPAGNPFEYLGRFGMSAEAGGLAFARARFYAPGLGRFISTDPIGLGGADVNLYRYASNQPVTAVDVTGLDGGSTKFSVGPVEVSGGWDEQGNFYLGIGATLGTPGASTTFNQQGECTGWNGSLTVGGISQSYGTPKGGAYVSGGGSLGIGANGNWAQGDPEVAYDAQFGVGAGTSVGWTFSFQTVQQPPLLQPPAHTVNTTSHAPSGPSDPNEKTGTAGFGAPGYVAAGSLLSYRVDFENEPTATAPARYVTVSDTLNENLDLGTFRLAEIGFGDTVFTVTGDVQHYETTTSMTYGGQTFDVQVHAALRWETREVYVTFLAVDRDTGLPPSVDVGFLPPEDGTGRGQGHFSYTINARPDLATGDEIRNVAEICFDFGEVIATNQVDPHDASKGTDPARECLSTIDAEAPSSAIATGSFTQAGRRIELAWTGQDDAGGSGIADYDLYVSVDAGAYAPAAEHVRDTEFVYAGEPGRAYGFYTVARDGAGNLEEAPAAPDAVVTLAPVVETTLDKAHSSLRFIDEDGTPVTVGWHEAGTVTIARWSDPARGGRGDIYSITIRGSSGSSRLTIAPDGGRTTVDTLESEGPLAELNLKNVDILSEVLLAAPAAQIEVGDLRSGARMVVGGECSEGWTLAAGRVGEGSILASACPIASLKVAEWQSGAISAPWLGRLAVSGDFGADLVLTGQGVPARRATLGDVKIAGQVTAGTWDIAGSGGTLKINSAAEGWQALFTGGLKHVTVAGNLSGQLTARSVDRVRVGGDMLNAGIALTLGPDAGGLALGRLDVKGRVDTSRLLAAGSMGRLVVGGLRNASIFAGVAVLLDENGDGFLDLPCPPVDVTAASSIDRLAVRGVANGYAILNSNVAAGFLGSASLRDAQFDNQGSRFGLAADSYGRVTYNDSDRRFDWAGDSGDEPPAYTDFVILAGRR